LKRPLTLVLTAWQKWIEIVTGISLPASAQIGPGLYIGHFGNVIVGAHVVMGEGCNLAQGVTIGVSGRGTGRGSPILGDGVHIAAGAVIAGRIRIGRGVHVAPNALVTRDVPEFCKVIGPSIQIIERSARGGEQRGSTASPG
jgi:serine O-acetyltransferase